MAGDRTIDWDRHWAAVDRTGLEEMRTAGERMARRLERYFDTFPPTVADVGCGPAFMLFELARSRPGTSFVGYDVAESVVADNRTLAADRGLSNLRFERASLPGLGVDREYDCITCIATLHYVAEIERAIGELFDRVAPGGTLIFNYPNRHTQRTYRNDETVDPERFELVLEGENLLSYEEIRRATGRRPRGFWKAVEEQDWRSIGQVNPCVVLEK